MPENEQNKQSDFMIEKIKERPINKKKLLRRTVTTAAMAVIFGLIACLTFLILEPVFNHWLYPEDEPIYVDFPEETDEMTPDEMIVEEPEDEVPDLEETVESLLQQGGQIEEILSEWILDADNYKQLYAALATTISEIQQSMVTVTGVTSNTDWLLNTYERQGQVSGVIIANNQRELLILAEGESFREVDSISVTFCNKEVVGASIKQFDAGTGFGIFAVPIENISQDTLDAVVVAGLGSSNLQSMLGTPVIAMGSPMGVVDSISYGTVTATGIKWPTVDASYQILFTDIYGSQNATGILFNLQKQVVGVIAMGRIDTDMDNMLTALGITELRKIISRMSNGRAVPYLGISGVDVTVDVNRQQKVPIGAYITDVVMDSPAMLAGIQRGDIVVRMSDTLVSSFADYTNTLLRLDPGDKVKIVVQRQVQDGYREVDFEIILTEAP